jgi:hypothetical protein
MLNAEEELMYHHTIRPTLTLLFALSSFAVASAADHGYVKGRDEGSFTSTAVTPTVVRTHDTSSGQATLIGGYRMVAEENINLSTLEVSNASFTITADNGDTLTGTYSGTARFSSTSATQLNYYVSGPITGGTGRFAGVTGAIAFFGSADLATFKFHDVVLGIVSESDELMQDE